MSIEVTKVTSAQQLGNTPREPIRACTTKNVAGHILGITYSVSATLPTRVAQIRTRHQPCRQLVDKLQTTCRQLVDNFSCLQRQRDCRTKHMLAYFMNQLRKLRATKRLLAKFDNEFAFVLQVSGALTTSGMCSLTRLRSLSRHHEWIACDFDQ